MTSGTVLSLQIKLARGQMDTRPSVVTSASGGLVGDLYCDHPDRKVLLLSRETLDEFGLDAGDLREQITLDMDGLQGMAGKRLLIGDVEFGVTIDCAPCLHMAQTLGVPDPPAWVASIAGKRGMFAIALNEGTIRVGDPVTLLDE